MGKAKTTIISVVVVIAAGGLGFGASQVFNGSDQTFSKLQTSKKHQETKKESSSKRESKKESSSIVSSTSSSSATQPSQQSNDQIAWQQFPNDDQHTHETRVKLMASNNPLDVEARGFDSHGLMNYKDDYAITKYDLATIQSSVLYSDRSDMNATYYNYVKAINTPVDERTPEQQDAMDNYLRSIGVDPDDEDSDSNYDDSDDEDNYDSNDDYDDEDSDY